MGSKNNKLPEQRERSGLLEGILNRKVTIDTDIMDFFLIAGWRKWYWSNPIYKKATPNLKKDIEKYLMFENNKLNHSDKVKRSLFVRSIRNQYPDRVQTIYDLKKDIESLGITFRNMGYAGLAYFNETLQKFGIEEIKVGGKFSYEKTLKMYGLKKAEM